MRDWRACLVAFLTIVVAGRTAAASWPTYAGGPHRLFFNPHPGRITAGSVARLRVKWKFHAGGPVTASPSVVSLDIPGKGRTLVAFVPSWDHNLYAIRVRDGAELWRFAMADQPGAPYPNAGSPDVRKVGRRWRVFIAGGETMYAVDALTGREVWHFTAGTGCTSGLCGFTGERNEIESSAIVADGKVFFGMDVNEENGKGGFYAVDVRDGHLVWYFDLETAATCRPRTGDDIRRFDGYHSEAELGLPAGVLTTRAGCDFARVRDGCGSVWSSAAIDERRQALYFTSASCDSGDNSGVYEEAIVSLHLDGTPSWHWRPRRSDTHDLDFGSVPNLFTITVNGKRRAVVGAGGKDGTYYVIDRDGVNRATGVRWNDADPSSLPYWRTQVVPGGDIGGIIATAAVDERARRVYFSTAPGNDADLFNPQRPTVHALDADTGAIVWQNTAEPDADASFAPTSAIPGAVFVGKNVGGALRAYDAATGAQLATFPVGVTVASAPAVVGGTVIVGSGSGSRGPDPTDPGQIEAVTPVDVTAFCVAGTQGCQ
ncbi:MAG TPA: PQQ-binding-like beta-propeller repeat protein [Candidatus Nitrosopolaris sp.]|nr:PQQ-binding-like beta-propeller repeat protein [Candidatus Nitrosopolaris sp.]